MTSRSGALCLKAIVGTTVDGVSFHHQTRTADVNSNGTHLILMTTLDVEPWILLINKRSGLEAQCRVIFRKRLDASRTELGPKFVIPQPKFWGIAFPPEEHGSPGGNILRIALVVFLLVICSLSFTAGVMIWRSSRHSKQNLGRHHSSSVSRVLRAIDCKRQRA